MENQPNNPEPLKEEVLRLKEEVDKGWQELNTKFTEFVKGPYTYDPGDMAYVAGMREELNKFSDLLNNYHQKVKDAL